MNIETTISEHTNPDAITGEHASHPGATGIGAAAGAATGAAAGAIGGPIGVVVGAVAGGIVGGLMGHGIGEWNDPSDELYWRKTYKSSAFYDETADFDQDVAPALQCGAMLAIEARDYMAHANAPIYKTYDEIKAEAARRWQTSRCKSRYDFDRASAAIQSAYLIKLHHDEDVMQGVAVYKDA